MTRTILNVAVAVALLCAPARAEIIERILATVGGGLILQSDAVAAIRLGFIKVPPEQNPLQWALDRLVERRLMLIEVERYGPAEPALAEIDAELQALDKRIGSGERLDEILRESGLSAGQLRVFLRDELRLASYLNQRFAAVPLQRKDEAIREWLSGLRRRTEVNVLYLPQR